MSEPLILEFTKEEFVCELCSQTFKADEVYNKCPNSKDGGHVFMIKHTTIKYKKEIQIESTRANK